MSGSYRQILRASSIIGGASIANLLIGLVRTKVVAVLLGPAGIGLIGLLQNLMTTASTVSSLGFGTVGTRQVAIASGRGDVHAVAGARRALFWGTLLLATIGAALFWALRHVLAEEILDDPRLSTSVGWLAVGVALTVASGSQGALLNGMRRIGDIGRVSVLSALLSTVLGVTALLLWRERGVLAFVISVPVASFFFGHLFVSRLPKVVETRTLLPQVLAQWKTLVRLGAAFMVAGAMVTVGQLAVQTMVQRKLGIEALGHFQAAWMISMTYIGFVLQAMGTDYYPRLAAAIHDHFAINRMVNEQTEIALLLAGPVFLVMIGLAPWIIELLYSNRFVETVDILRWQVLGDILKVAAWPLGFVILAAGNGRLFMLSESLSIVVFIGLVWVGMPLVGVEATGIAFVGMYGVCLPTVFFLARRKTGFAWQRRVYMQLVLLIGLALMVFLASLWSESGGAVLGVTAGAMLALQGMGRLGHIADLNGSIGSVAATCRQLLMKVGLWRD